MAFSTYLRLAGAKSGPIKGPCTQKGHKGQILVIAASHNILIPRDAVSGLPAGKRQHKPFSITKEVDISSVPLYSMLVSNETIREWEMQVWATPATPKTGAPAQCYTVTLIDAAIAEIRYTMPDTRNPDLAGYGQYEELIFTYSKIQWTWTQGNIPAMDDWETV